MKRAFDRFDNSGVFSFGAKRFDRYDEENPYGYNYNTHIYKRSADPMRFVSMPAKKAFDRMDASDFFGAKRKRSFDRMGGTEFGLMKRSVPENRGEGFGEKRRTCFFYAASRTLRPSDTASYMWSRPTRRLVSQLNILTHLRANYGDAASYL